MRAFLYCRVAHDDSFTLEHQRFLLKFYAKQAGYTIIGAADGPTSIFVGNFYGTPKSFVREALKEKSVILEIDVVGALNAKKFFPECLLIMIVPPSEEELKKRLKGRRSETEEQIRNRLARIEYELSKKELYDYVVVNDTLENALSRLEEIIDDEKNK